ncbi:MAG: 30S ribosomal protein S3 [Ardenticatenaceae bacterium]|nr:30S ribosomal protein S3 [Ardenticatenaceae bacterium]
MGRKVHPNGFRLKVIRDWNARWFAEGTRYSDLLNEDFQIRELVNKVSSNAGISKIEIERFPNQVQVTIWTSKPGVVIGRKGAAVKELRNSLRKLTGKAVRLEVEEVSQPEIEAALVAQSISGQLERRVSHSRAMKRAVQLAMRQGAQGIRVEVAGRLNGSDMARREKMIDGRVPRNTLRADIDFGKSEALTTFGRIGVKVWIYKGEVLPQKSGMMS